MCRWKGSVRFGQRSFVYTVEEFRSLGAFSSMWPQRRRTCQGEPGVLGARRRAPPTRSRSPVTIDAHRSLKRTEPFHPTNEAPAARSERNHSTLQTRPPQPEANRTIPPYKRGPRSLKRTEPFHPTNEAPAARSKRNNSTVQKAQQPEANKILPQNSKKPRPARAPSMR